MVPRADGGRSASAAAERRAGNYWPTPDQLLLLRACLLAGDEAADAWQALRGRVDVETLDTASRRLLPLLYRSMRRWSEPDPVWWPPLKAAHRRTWSQNQRLFRQAAPLVDELGRAGIDVMLLKGAALIRPYYDGDTGLRPMSDLDLAVRPARAAEALAVLRRCGWTSLHATTASFLRVKHAELFDGGDGRLCDLHWHVFEDACRPDDDDELWRASGEAELAGRAVRALSPSDQLLHVCAHGARWAEVPGIRWIADAMLVLAAGPVDWTRVVEQARRLRYVIRMRETLAFLKARMSAPVPDQVVQSLAAAPASPIERFERRILDREHRLLGRLPLDWCHHRRAHDGGRLSATLAFPGYLRHAWGLPTLREVPGGALGRAAQRLRRLLELTATPR